MKLAIDEWRVDSNWECQILLYGVRKHILWSKKISKSSPISSLLTMVSSSGTYFVQLGSASQPLTETDCRIHDSRGPRGSISLTRLEVVLRCYASGSRFIRLSIGLSTPYITGRHPIAVWRHRSTAPSHSPRSGIAHHVHTEWGRTMRSSPVVTWRIEVGMPVGSLGFVRIV
jgi:hypothetical protein